MSKVCTKCREEKPLTEFSKQSRGLFGLRADCKSCCAAWKARWRLENLESERAKGRAKYWQNPEAARQATEKWKAANFEKVVMKDRLYKEINREILRVKDRARIAADPVKHREKSRKYREANPGKCRAANRRSYERNPERTTELRRARDLRRRSTPKGRITNSIRAALHRYITRGCKRGRRTFELLGYTADDLMVHLQKRFSPGMTWDNYGAWHVDHIIPLAAFNYEDPIHSDFKKAWQLKNLQPLWATDNQKKRAKIFAPFQPSLAI